VEHSFIALVGTVYRFLTIFVLLSINDPSFPSRFLLSKECCRIFDMFFDCQIKSRDCLKSRMSKQTFFLVSR
jgi:hypothetical protein